MTTDLSGQVAVVTGGNGGIGLGMAKGMADVGADIAIWARNAEKNAAAVAELEAMGVRAAAFACDVADEDQTDAAMRATVDTFGRVDVCVANAGVGGPPAAFTDITLDDWRNVMSVNLDGAFLTFRAAVRQMLEQGEGGSLIAVSSVSAVHGSPAQPHYAASKTGLLAMCRALAVGMARHGIRVNAVLPGWTRTDMSEGGYQYEPFREATTKRTPVRRWGTPDDLSAVAAFLADKSNVFHTGDTITVDGGYTVF